VENLIQAVLSNFTLTFFVLGLLCSGASIALQKMPLSNRDQVYEIVFKWYLFFSIGAAFAYGFIGHVFFGALAAQFIGWAPSPFQLEVGFASLGFSILGFMAFAGNWNMRLAAVIASAVFLWGAAVGHIIQMIQFQNYTAGNAGIIFYTDSLLPVFSIWLLWVTRPRKFYLR
jgi:hypothetical protein